MLVYIMDVLINVHSYKWVIEKQHILHVLELHAQHNILYIYIYTSVNPVHNADK